MKNRYTPGNPIFFYKILGLKVYAFHGLVFLIFSVFKNMVVLPFLSTIYTFKGSVIIHVCSSKRV